MSYQHQTVADALHDTHPTTTTPGTQDMQLRQEATTGPWRHVVESVFDATLCADERGTVVYCSPSTKSLFATSPKGQRFWEALDMPANSLEEALAACDGNGMCRVAVAGGTRKLALKILPLPEMQAQGHAYALLLMGLDALMDFMGDARESAESPLVQALARSIFEEAKNAILLLDRQGYVVAANEQAKGLFARGGPERDEIPESLEGEQLETLLSREQGRELQGQVFSMNGKSLNCCCTLSGSHDGKRPLEVYASKVDMGRQRFLYKLIFEDMSERKALEEGLQQKSEEVHEMQITLRNVMRSAVQEKESFKEDLSHMIKVEVLPTLRKMSMEPDEALRSNYQSVIQDQLGELAGTASDEPDVVFYELTPTEMQVCEYIRAGHATKEISETMHLAFETVQTHRKNIRRKLGLKGRKVSLYMFLRSRGRMS